MANDVGTGRMMVNMSYDSAGKTGTAELGKSRETKLEEKHSWYAGFAPVKKPRYVVLVLVVKGGHGNEAALPIAREILSYLMERKS